MTNFPMSSQVVALQTVIQQNRDIRAGRDAMHLSRETYFRRLTGQTDAEFETMVTMAPVYTLYPKVVDGFVGTIFRKPVLLTGGDNFDQANVDLLGNSLEEYSQEVTKHVFEDGFCATVTDWSDKLGRSFFKFIKPEQFVSFLTTNDNGYPELSRFIYTETIEEPSEDGGEFETTDSEYFSVLDMEVIDDVKIVRFRQYKSLKDGDPETQIGPTTYLTRQGQNLTELPALIHGINPNNFSVQKSPLQDISDLNISVDQRVVDLVYLLHWSALPTPWVTGVDPDDPDAPSSIGPTKAWLISSPEAKVGMLEFSGKSYDAHISYIDSLMYIMSAIGAQILKKEGVSRETASSVLIRTGAQTSLIATIVDNISGQLAELVKMRMNWDGLAYDDTFSLELNRDFIQVEMEPNAQIALVKSWLDGAVSFDSMFAKMKEGELVPPERTVDEELALIKKNKPPFFAKAVDHENALKENDGGEQPSENGMTGSNLETGTGVSNPLATENV